MVSQINGAFNDIADLQMKGFLWHQGEADKSPTNRANYSTAWNAMMTNLISRTAVTAETSNQYWEDYMPMVVMPPLWT